jgi:hypothetical protein
MRMCRLICLSVTLAVLSPASSWAQNADRFRFGDDPFSESSEDTATAVEVTPVVTPEATSNYPRDPRIVDPRTLVQQNAAFRGAQRQYRLAALQWYGYSNLRPVASPQPFYSTYSPPPPWAGNSWGNNWIGGVLWWR